MNYWRTADKPCEIGSPPFKARQLIGRRRFCGRQSRREGVMGTQRKRMISVNERGRGRSAGAKRNVIDTGDAYRISVRTPRSGTEQMKRETPNFTATYRNIRDILDTLAFLTKHLRFFQERSTSTQSIITVHDAFTV